MDTYLFRVKRKIRHHDGSYLRWRGGNGGRAGCGIEKTWDRSERELQLCKVLFLKGFT